VRRWALMICKKCGARVISRMMANGGRVICDPMAITYWRHRKGAEIVLSLKGVYTYADLDGSPEKATGIGWIPHKCREARNGK